MYNEKYFTLECYKLFISIKIIFLKMYLFTIFATFYWKFNEKNEIKTENIITQIMITQIIYFHFYNKRQYLINLTYTVILFFHFTDVCKSFNN